MVRLMQGWGHQLLPSYGGKGLRWGFRDETVHSLVPHTLRTAKKYSHRGKYSPALNRGC